MRADSVAETAEVPEKISLPHSKNVVSILLQAASAGAVAVALAGAAALGVAAALAMVHSRNA